MVAALVTLQRQNPHFLRQLPQLRPLLEPRKMLPLILLSAIAASGSLNSVVGARTIRQGGVVTGSGRAPPPQEHSGDCLGFYAFWHSMHSESECTKGGSWSREPTTLQSDERHIGVTDNPQTGCSVLNLG